MKNNQYTTEEKLNVVRTFISSGLTKWEFTKLHPEYKSSTLYGWLVQYSNQLENATGSSDSTPVSTSDLDTTTKFNCVIDTAKMNELEIGAYCRSKGIYSNELNSWRLNCMTANDSKQESLNAELLRLRAENKALREEKSKALRENKKQSKEIERMKDALTEYAVKEAFLKKAQALFGENTEEC